jgi:hypothetical protein
VEHILAGFESGEYHPQEWNQKKQSNEIDDRVAEQGFEKVADFVYTHAPTSFFIRFGTQNLIGNLSCHFITLRSK